MTDIISFVLSDNLYLYLYLSIFKCFIVSIFFMYFVNIACFEIYYEVFILFDSSIIYETKFLIFGSLCFHENQYTQ